MNKIHEKIAIIGSGFSGLAMASALKRAKISYDQFDQNDEIGGNWYNVVYDSGHTITSPDMTEFPDFPMPKEYPQFPSKKQIHDYLLSYVNHYQLRDNLFLRSEIKMVKPISDNQWQLTFGNGEIKQYKGVIVANGLFRQSNIPQYPGSFSGEIMHASNYKSPSILKDKRILVVGAGNSGVDISVESSLHAKITHVSMRDTPWILPKTIAGKPISYFFNPILPMWFKRSLLKTFVGLIHGNYGVYGLEKPKHNLFTKPPTVNDSFMHSLKHGKLTPQKEIEKYNGNSVHFIDGTSHEYDMIIFATGYRDAYPMIEEGIIPYTGKRAVLVQGIYTQTHKNLYFFGAGFPNNGIGPVVHAGSQLVIRSIELQEKLTKPIGYLFAKAGAKPFRNRIHPKIFIKECRRYSKMANNLSRFDK
jgi:cation diffusion facilitator CzcD-associated flavoprotein CzcO